MNAAQIVYHITSHFESCSDGLHMYVCMVTLARHSFRTLLQDTHSRHLFRTLFQDTPLGHSFRTLFRTLLQGTRACRYCKCKSTWPICQCGLSLPRHMFTSVYVCHPTRVSAYHSSKESCKRWSTPKRCTYIDVPLNVCYPTKCYILTLKVTCVYVGVQIPEDVSLHTSHSLS